MLGCDCNLYGVCVTFLVCCGWPSTYLKTPSGGRDIYMRVSQYLESNSANLKGGGGDSVLE